MSSILEAQEDYFYLKMGLHPFVPAVFRAHPGLINTKVTEWWDEKINSDALYSSSDTERFKQDVLPLINKRLGL